MALTLGTSASWLVEPLEPAQHTELAVHRGGGANVLRGLLTVAPTPIQPSEARVKARDERAHTEFAGERETRLILR